jgi:hypothetical protein
LIAQVASVTIFWARTLSTFSPGQNFFQRRNLQPGRSERLLDNLFGLGFFVFHRPRRGPPGGRVRPLLRVSFLPPIFEHAEKNFGAKDDPIAQFFFAHPGDKRIGIVEFLETPEAYHPPLLSRTPPAATST